MALPLLSLVNSTCVMLYESLEEEKAADALLTTLAKGEVNQDSVSAFATNLVSS